VFHQTILARKVKDSGYTRYKIH